MIQSPAKRNGKVVSQQALLSSASGRPFTKQSQFSTGKSGVAKFGGECLGGSESLVRPIRAYDALPSASFAERDPIEGSRHHRGAFPDAVVQISFLGRAADPDSVGAQLDQLRASLHKMGPRMARPHPTTGRDPRCHNLSRFLTCVRRVYA